MNDCRQSRRLDRRWISRLVGVFAAASLGTACCLQVEVVGQGDGGPTPDSGTQVDAGIQPDSGPVIDNDAGSSDDGGDASDAGAADSGVQTDAGLSCLPCPVGFACNPADGLCECGGVSDCGLCDVDSGTCVPGCPFDGGAGPLSIKNGATYSWHTNLGQTLELFEIPGCGVPPYIWEVIGGAVPTGLTFAAVGTPAVGDLSGVSMQVDDGGPYELVVQVLDSTGASATEVVLLYVE